MEPHFVPATLADENLLLELMAEFYAVEHLPFDVAVARAGLRELIENSAYGWVHWLRVEGKAAGYMVVTLGFSLEFHGRGAWVDEIYVREAWRGQGLGRASLAFAEELGRRAGIKALRLEVDRGNARAQRLYRATGFQDHDRFLLTKWL